MRVGEGIELRWENMLAGIRQQADWLERGPRELLNEAQGLIEGPPPPRIYLAGCGDSHYAGLAARLAFERWSGIPTQALPSLELSRYELELAPAGSWVVCVSNSGKVVRTVEAAVNARARGLMAIAVTYDPASRLAEAADVTLAFRYADQILPPKYGFPMKLRIPTKLGFKNPKHIVEIMVSNTYLGGYWEDQGYNWYSGS